MDSTRIEQAVDELDIYDDDDLFDPSCDDIRLAWLAHESMAERTQDGEAHWSDR
jgi:hypothetical protein